MRVTDLITWLETAQLRWESGGEVTAERTGNTLAIYQNGKYRATIDLDDEQPSLSQWADEDA